MNAKGGVKTVNNVKKKLRVVISEGREVKGRAKVVVKCSHLNFGHNLLRIQYIIQNLLLRKLCSSPLVICNTRVL